MSLRQRLLDSGCPKGAVREFFWCAAITLLSPGVEKPPTQKTEPKWTDWVSVSGIGPGNWLDFLVFLIIVVVLPISWLVKWLKSLAGLRGARRE